MRVWKLAFLGTTFVLPLNGVASAETSLFTPATFKATNNVVACRLANVSGKDIPLRVEIINSFGAVIVDTGNISVEPGHIVVGHEFAGLDGERYCKFSGKFGKAAVRASLTIFDPAGNPLSALPAE